MPLKEFLLAVLFSIKSTFPSYPLDLAEDPQEVEAGELFEVVERPRPRGQEAGEQRGVLGHVLQARRRSERGKEKRYDKLCFLSYSSSSFSHYVATYKCTEIS